MFYRKCNQELMSSSPPLINNKHISKHIQLDLNILHPVRVDYCSAFTYAHMTRFLRQLTAR